MGHASVPQSRDGLRRKAAAVDLAVHVRKSNGKARLTAPHSSLSADCPAAGKDASSDLTVIGSDTLRDRRLGVKQKAMLQQRDSGRTGTSAPDRFLGPRPQRPHRPANSQSLKI